jgi:hypothetical protein
MSLTHREIVADLLEQAILHGQHNEVPKEDMWGMVCDLLGGVVGDSSAQAGWLEIDHERGVIYFHRAEGTLLRICRLPAPIPEDANFIDITILHPLGEWQKPTVAYSRPTILRGGDTDDRD